MRWFELAFEPTHFCSVRLGKRWARAQNGNTFGLKIKPGYEFYDRGITASKDVRLPELERAIAAVVDRKVEALIVPALDRLSRRGMRHVGELLDAVEGAGGRIILGKEGLDSASPGSRAVIMFLAEQACAEARAHSWRLATWQEGCRLKGKWTGKRPYGYLVVDSRLVPHPGEAPIVRRIVTAYLSGQGCRQIASMLNAEGVPSPNMSRAEEIRARGGQPKNQPTTWGLSTIAELLVNPVLVGWRQHRGQVVLDAEGEPVSFGTGILEPRERERLLAERDRRTTILQRSSLLKWIDPTNGDGRAPRYLLAGLATCQSCGYSMVGHNRPERGYVVYRCSTFINGYICQACAHIQATTADEEVRCQLVGRLAAIEPADPIHAAKAERLERSVLVGDLGGRADLQCGRSAVRDRVADYLSSGEWDAIPLERRRQLLRVATDRIIIVPANRQRRIPASDRVRILLAGEDAYGAAVGADQRRLGRWARTTAG